MKTFIFIFLLMANTCFGQEWVAEVMVGVSGYNGDLTQQRVSFQTMRPATNINIKYNTGDFISLKDRNLSFKTNILEANVGVEVPLLDPETFYAYPYVFAGVGVFHFNPYTLSLIHI